MNADKLSEFFVGKVLKECMLLPPASYVLKVCSSATSVKLPLRKGGKCDVAYVFACEEFRS